MKAILLNKFGSERIFTLNKLSVVLGIPPDILSDFSDTAEKHYHPFIMTKGTKKRKIANPSKALKAIQKRIAEKLLSLVPLPDEICGGRKGISVKDNAKIHLGQPEVVTIDLRDCFPSISFELVFDLFRNEFGYSKEVSGMLTKLTTYRRSLPQGGVTSGALVNILLIPLCGNIRSILPKESVLSMWVDDITFSGAGAHLYCQDVVKEVQMFGFRVRSKKVKVMFANQPQLVTGLVTNVKLSVPKKKIKGYIRDHQENRSNKESTVGRMNHVSFINHGQGKKLKKRINTSNK
ncbi:MAG: reverse transcriptase family protein [Candidatus Paceibacterota bacterium]|jgi:RNA-directed DNA polymerase